MTRPACNGDCGAGRPVRIGALLASRMDASVSVAKPRTLALDEHQAPADAQSGRIALLHP
jgi:hypothetical protein